MKNLKRNHKYIVFLTLALVLSMATSVYASYFMSCYNNLWASGNYVYGEASTSTDTGVNELYAANYLYEDGTCVDSSDTYNYYDNYSGLTGTGAYNPSGTQYWKSMGDHQATDGVTYSTQTTYRYLNS